MFKAFYCRFHRTFEAAECGIGGDLKFVGWANAIYKFYFGFITTEGWQALPAIAENFTLCVKNLP
jgi:hypothetical protein